MWPRWSWVQIPSLTPTFLAGTGIAPVPFFFFFFLDPLLHCFMVSLGTEPALRAGNLGGRSPVQAGARKTLTIRNNEINLGDGARGSGDGAQERSGDGAQERSGDGARFLGRRDARGSGDGGGVGEAELGGGGGGGGGGGEVRGRGFFSSGWRWWWWWWWRLVPEFPLPRPGLRGVPLQGRDRRRGHRRR